MFSMRKVEHWVKVKRDAKETLAKFDREKDKLVQEQEHANLKEMECMLIEERQKSKNAVELADWSSKVWSEKKWTS